MSKKHQREVSALSMLLGHPLPDFFEEFWERAPLLCHGAHQRLTCWDKLPSWQTLLHILKRAGNDALVLKEQHPTRAYPSVAAAYLDGCSIIVNHAEQTSAGVAELCRALRADVPHCFGNLYVTPPAGKAVDAHADDRDVLVVQLGGEKEWRVYAPPPIHFPTTTEQVGKAGLVMPPAATAACSESLHVKLRVGDILYIPRGFVRPTPDA